MCVLHIALKLLGCFYGVAKVFCVGFCLHIAVIAVIGVFAIQLLGDMCGIF